MTSASDSVAESLVRESHQKRRRIATSLWPRARLMGEILWHQVDRDHLFTQASALTYKTLFSLLPIFVLSLLVLSSISAGGGKNALDSATSDVKEMVWNMTGMNKMQVSEEVKTNVELFIDNAQKSVSSRTTGMVAFAVLLYGAISLMVVIESTFNQMYGSVKPRTWPRRIMLYWCVLTLGPIGVAGSIVLGRSAYTTATSAVGVGWILSTANILTGFFISWLLILLMYRLIPDTHVRWRPAIIGSFLAAVAWEVGKWAFGIYVQRAATQSWYGRFALLPLFMFWIYITWSVVLLGLEITYVQQYWPLLKRRFFFTRSGRTSVMLSDLRWVLSMGVLIYKNFREGKLTSLGSAAEALMLPNDVTGELMIALEQAGLVHCVSEDSYALARPPESITAYDLLTSARLICQIPPELGKESQQAHIYPDSAALKELEELESAWAKTRNLVDLAK